MNSSQIEFMMAARCWVYPFCYLPPSKEKCYRIAASGLQCDECAFQVRNEMKAKEYNRIYEQQMIEREAKHYEFIQSKRWKDEVRPKIVKHDDNHCAICREKVEMKNAHIHHIIDYSSDEDLSPQNLVTLCSKCHSKLHPVFPSGMWTLGWPDRRKVQEALSYFYDEVKETSKRNGSRFKAPLEHLMMHICLLCSLLQECEIGKSADREICETMKDFNALLRARAKFHFIAELHEKMSNCVVEGRVVSLDEPEQVETRYGTTTLVGAKLRDETGEITLNLFGEQSTKVKAGDIVVVENAYTSHYEGRLTLNVPREGGTVKTKATGSESTEPEKNKEEYPYHRAAVSKLDGSSLKGTFSEVSILRVLKNQHFPCPKHCMYYEKQHDSSCYKKPLMNKPTKDELTCTIVLADLKSSLPPDMGSVLLEGLARLLDSKGRGYQGHIPYLCEELHSLAKQRYGYISRGYAGALLIFEGTKETILLPFPEVPEDEEIRGFIIALRSRKGLWNELLETYDFRLV